MEIVTNATEVFALVNNGLAATFGFTTLLDFHTPALCNVQRFDVSVEGLNGLTVYFHAQNNTIGKAFNDVLSTNSGMVRYIKSTYTQTENSRCESVQKRKKGDNALTITEVSGVILLLALGTSFALCAFAYECLRWHFHSNKTSQ